MAGPQPAAKAIPVTVIGGFLGAGKTTLLLHWLQHSAGRRIAVLVNDFGALNIDAALVAQASGDAGGETIAPPNGCVCCAIGDDLSAALGHVIAQQPPIDAIVIEASGVSDPWRIAQVALVDRQLVLAGVIVLVDAAALPAHLADPLLADSLSRPLAHADLVLLNHADRCDTSTLASARAWVAQHAAAVPLLATVQARLPAGLAATWLGRGTALHQARGGGLAATLQDSARNSADRSAAQHARQYDRWSVQPGGQFNPKHLRAWLRALPPGVLRLKGVLPGLAGGADPATGPSWWELHYAGRHGQLRRLPAAPAGGAALLAIGLAGQLPVSALTDGLAGCAAHNPVP